MSDKTLTVGWEGGDGAACVCLLVVPARAVAEPGYIKGMHASGASDKHELQALAQTAYYQYQDDELEFESVASPIVINASGILEQVDAGLVLYRDQSGSIRAVVHGSLSLRKLLESAHRFCTRWVRLDI